MRITYTINLCLYAGLLACIFQTGAAESLTNPALIFPVVNNPLSPSSRWQAIRKPYPTNAWFINFVVEPKNARTSYPVNGFPYLITLEEQGIAISYSKPYFYSEPNHPSIISALFYPFMNQISLGSAETMSSYGVQSVHGLSLTLQWQNQYSRGFTAPLVQGSPYLTEFFKEATPQLHTRFNMISINQQTTFETIAPSSRYELVIGDNLLQAQTWIIYCEHPLHFNLLDNDNGTTLMATEPYNGWIRLILQKDEVNGINNDAKMLDQYSNTIVLDYQQSYRQDKHNITYTFDWITQNNQPPLHLSLPHQRRANPTSSPVNYYGIKGWMIGETLSHWEINLPIPEIRFLPLKKLSLASTNLLKKTLKSEVLNLLKYPFPDDGPYRVGKRLARAALLVVYADYLKEFDLKNQVLNVLESQLMQKMIGKTTWSLQYDATWGGIIPSLEDYGARHYNDHHYHYGYWVYTFAVIAKFHPDWLNTTIKGYSFAPKDWVNILIRDYANPSYDDPYFPAQRYQDDYAGHSWASGLSAFEDGQNEQSSSEAVNAYYAIALYGRAINDEPLARWGKFLTARELRSAQTYWQVMQNSEIYNEKFWQNNGVIGNLWGAKVDVNTFFKPCNTRYRCGLDYSYGIQMLPLNAISLQLLDKKWLAEVAPTIKNIITSMYGPVEASWQWILIKGIASVLSKEEKQSFLKKAIDSNINEYDNGDSKTNTLFFLMSDELESSSQKPRTL